MKPYCGFTGGHDCTGPDPVTGGICKTARDVNAKYGIKFRQLGAVARQLGGSFLRGFKGIRHDFVIGMLSPEDQVFLEAERQRRYGNGQDDPPRHRYTQEEILQLLAQGTKIILPSEDEGITNGRRTQKTVTRKVAIREEMKMVAAFALTAKDNEIIVQQEVAGRNDALFQLGSEIYLEEAKYIRGGSGWPQVDAVHGDLDGHAFKNFKGFKPHLVALFNQEILPDQLEFLTQKDTSVLVQIGPEQFALKNTVLANDELNKLFRRGPYANL
jgi:hypothetical protein